MVVGVFGPHANTCEGTWEELKVILDVIAMSRWWETRNEMFEGCVSTQVSDIFGVLY